MKIFQMATSKTVVKLFTVIVYGFRINNFPFGREATGAGEGGVWTLHFFLKTHFAVKRNDHLNQCKFSIHLLDLTRNSCGKCNYRFSGRNGTCGPAIPVQGSNQLSYSRYRESISCRALTTSSCI